MPGKPTTHTAFTRFECIDPDHNHNKFYEISAEMLLFGPAVTRRWGRIGCRRPRTLSKDYETWLEAKRKIKGILGRREKRGYKVIQG